MNIIVWDNLSLWGSLQSKDTRPPSSQQVQESCDTSLTNDAPFLAKGLYALIDECASIGLSLILYVVSSYFNSFKLI